MGKIKIALLLFGQARFVNNFKVIESYKKKLFEPYEVDTFGHIWFSEREDVYSTSSWSKIEECPVNKNTIHEINSIYPNPRIIYEKSRKFKVPQVLLKKFNSNPNFSDKNLENIISHLYSFEKSSINLKGFESNYDFIIISRTDSIINYLPDLNTLDKNSFYLSNHHDKFPDLIFLFGIKYLNFLKTYENFEHNI